MGLCDLGRSNIGSQRLCCNLEPLPGTRRYRKGTCNLVSEIPWSEGAILPIADVDVRRNKASLKQYTHEDPTSSAESRKMHFRCYMLIWNGNSQLYLLV